MFGKLPELFDRNFAVGYFLPSTLFLVTSLALANEFGHLPAIISMNTASQVDVLIGTTIVGLMSWLASTLLLATNRDVLRLMEGYGCFNPSHLLGWVEKRRYKKLLENISKLDEEYLSCISEKIEFPKKLRLKRNRLMRESAERFPDEEQWLLPNSFGNTIRAFEVYPRVMYGLDAIPGWSRLLGVLPEEYRGLVNNAKIQVDFWANLWLLSLMTVVEYVGLALRAGQVRILWFPFVAFSIALVAFSRATSSAVEWGDLIKSSFDVFLPELCEKLGLLDTATVNEKKVLWRKFSQSIIYRNPKYMPMPNQDKVREEDIKVEQPETKCRIAHIFGVGAAILIFSLSIHKLLEISERCLMKHNRRM